MSEQKGIGSKLLGLFVEVDSEPRSDAGELPSGDGEKTAAELVAELANQSTPAAKRPGAPMSATPSAPMSGRNAAPAPLPAEEPALKLDKLPAPPAAGVTPATVDFESVFKTAGMDTSELDRVKKAEDLLKSLPDATPVDIKKQIVEASLKAFGFQIEKIVAAAQNQKRAIDTYVRVNETATAKAIQDAEAQIRSFTEKIAGLQADITKRTSGLAGLNAAAEARKLDVQKVIDFFQGPQQQAPKTPDAQ